MRTVYRLVSSLARHGTRSTSSRVSSSSISSLRWKHDSRPSFPGRPLATAATARPDGVSAVSEGVAAAAASLPLSPELERALSLADQIVGNSATSTHSLQHVLAEEVAVVTQILHKLVGTTHSLLEVEKLYQNGHHSDQLIRGLSVLLISKAGAAATGAPVASVNEEGVIEGEEKQKAKQATLWQSQLVLAKVVEMINMAMIIHREICNIDSVAITQTAEGSALHLSNKISVLYGDFLWAKAWKDLADLHQIEVTDMMVSVLVNTTQGQFVSEQELVEVASKLNLEYWLEKNFLLSACLPAFGCKSVLKLAAADEGLQTAAYQFGQNLGYFLKAHQEINWYINARANSRDYLDFCALPVVMHSVETGEPLEHLAAMAVPSEQQHPKLPKYDYSALHQLVRSGPGLVKSKTVLEMFRANAFTNLNHFPDSAARDCLKKLLSAMNI